MRVVDGGFNLAATRLRHGFRMMMRTIAALTLALSLCAGSVAAAEKAEGKGDVGQYVDLQPVGLPIVSNGRLVNYVFVYVRINLTSAANAAKWREKEPHFRDALVRAGHRTPFTDPKDLSKLDSARLVATLNRDASVITGPGQIRSVEVTSQEPRRRISVPRA